MRILIAHNYYQVPGGEDTVARAEIELLKSCGEDVFVYERSNDDIARLSWIQKIRFLSSMAHQQSAYADIRKLIRDHQIEVAHFHNIFYMMSPSVYRACRDEGVAVVQSLHNFRMMCSNGLLYRDGHVCEDCLKHGVWQGVRHRCFRQSTVMTAAMAFMLDRHWQRNTWLNDVDLYVAAAEFTRRKHIERGIPEHKIILKPHFVDSVTYPREDRGYVLYLGRLSDEKGVRVLCEAWRALDNIPLKIVGNGPLESELKSCVKQHGLARVEFLGFLEQDRVRELLTQARVVVMPSLCYENFPRVVVEAYASGVPIVASRLGSLAELITHKQTGCLFEPGNAVELAESVRWCFDNPSDIDRMGKNARRVFEEKYTGQKNYHQLIQIYQQAIRCSMEVA